MILAEAPGAALWAAERLGCTFVPPYVAIAVLDDDYTMRGAAVFNDYADCNVEMTCTGSHWVTPQVAHELAAYCFDTLGCQRVTLRTRKSNRDVRAMILRLGAKQEGTLRRWYGTEDAILYGLLKHECRFYKGQKP